jgi:hypothetical protein
VIFTRRTVPNALAALARAIKAVVSKAPVIVEMQVADIREARCGVCPHHRNGQCELCTCVVSMKVLLATESCPDNPPRWKQQTRFSTGV